MEQLPTPDWNDPILTKIDSLGRPLHIYLSDLAASERPSIDDALGRRRWDGPPSYGAGNERAISEEYQGLVSHGVRREVWPNEVMELAGRLIFPPEDESADSFEGMVQYHQGVENAVKDAAPELVAAITPFAQIHGLNVIPWGIGWLLQNLPGLKSPDPAIELVLPSPPPCAPVKKRKPVQARQYHDPSHDALLLYLILSGVWKHQDRFEWAKALCQYAAGGADGGLGREDALRRGRRIGHNLGVDRPGGRPSKQSRWTMDGPRTLLSSWFEWEVGWEEGVGLTQLVSTPDPSK